MVLSQVATEEEGGWGGAVKTKGGVRGGVRKEQLGPEKEDNKNSL